MLIGDEEVRRALSWGPLIDALGDAFAASGDVEVPLRHHHDVATVDGDGVSTLLIMPAWSDRYIGVKVVGICPANRGRAIPTITGHYLLTDATDGSTLAIIDAGELTARRTAAASVLASRYLAPPDPVSLLVVGAGRVASTLARAYSAEFTFEQITVWNRNPEGAARLAAGLQDERLPATATEDLPAACASADIVTCATATSAPVVLGGWLRSGTHLDLVGGFTPETRECDDDAIRGARVFVDTRQGALAEAGDIIIPLRDGVIGEADIAGDLPGLCSGVCPGRVSEGERTVFKSVGHATEDLAAAVAVYRAVVQNER